MSLEGFKLDPKHSQTCLCQDDDDEMTFIVTDGEDWKRDKLGRKHRTHKQLWVRFRCNDPDCPAIALVRWDKLSQFITRGVRG